MKVLIWHFNHLLFQKSRNLHFGEINRIGIGGGWIEGATELHSTARDPSEFKNLFNNTNPPKRSNNNAEMWNDNSDDETTLVRPIRGRRSRGGRGSDAATEPSGRHKGK